jgi:hypothetical protein
VYRFWWTNLKERDYLEDLDVDERIILKWVLKKWYEGHGLDQCGLGMRHLVDFCECGNESSGYTKLREFLNQLRTCSLLRKDYVPWS